MFCWKRQKSQGAPSLRSLQGWATTDPGAIVFTPGVRGRVGEGTLRLDSGLALPRNHYFFRKNFTNSGSLLNAAEYFSHSLCSTAGAPLTIAPASMSPATPLCGVTIAPSPTLQ